MPNRGYLSTPIKEAIVAAKISGKSVREVSKNFAVSVGTVSRLCAVAASEGSIERRAKSGRPKITTKRQEQAIIRNNKKHPNMTATDAAHYARSVFGVEISNRTARRILNRHGLLARVPARKPFMKDSHRKERLRFARAYKHWTSADWAKVIWSDEAPFRLHNPKRGRFIRRPIKQKFNILYTRPTVKFGGGLINVWGKLVLKYTCTVDFYRVHVP